MDWFSINVCLEIIDKSEPWVFLSQNIYFGFSTLFCVAITGSSQCSKTLKQDYLHLHWWQASFYPYLKKIYSDYMWRIYQVILKQEGKEILFYSTRLRYLMVLEKSTILYCTFMFLFIIPLISKGWYWLPRNKDMSFEKIHFSWKVKNALLKFHPNEKPCPIF